MDEIKMANGQPMICKNTTEKTIAKIDKSDERGEPYFL
jgi:hypothetical protein